MAKLTQLTGLLKQRTVQSCLNLDQLLHSAYNGISSKFLVEQIEKRGGNFKQIEKAQQNNNDPSGKKSKTKDRVWAGSLHIDLNILGKKKQKVSDSQQLFGKSQKAQLKQKTQTDLIKDYFDEITAPKALTLKWGQEESKQWWANKTASNDVAAAAAEKKRIEEEAD